MMDCGGGKNGNGNQENFAVATSHRVRNNPSTSNHGVRRRRPALKRPSRLPLNVATTMPPAMTKAAIASSWVRDQSPISCHHRHDRPKPTHARLANTPVPPVRKEIGSESGRPSMAAPSSTDCASATSSDTEYVDIDPLRKFRCIGARLENRDALQVVRIGLQLPLELGPDGMMMMGVIPDHGLQILQAGGLGRVRLERGRRLVRVLRYEHRRIEQGLRDGARNQRLLAHETAAQSDNAAGLVLIFAIQIGGDFLVCAVLQPEIGDRIGGQECMNLALLDGELE